MGQTLLGNPRRIAPELSPIRRVCDFRFTLPTSTARGLSPFSYQPESNSVRVWLLSHLM
jgi:hypothetical protein